MTESRHTPVEIERAYRSCLNWAGGAEIRTADADRVLLCPSCLADSAGTVGEHADRIRKYVPESCSADSDYCSDCGIKMLGSLREMLGTSRRARRTSPIHWSRLRVKLSACATP